MRYRHDVPAGTVFGTADEKSLTFLQEVPDGANGFKQNETKVFFDIQALHEYLRKCEWPAAKIANKEKRLNIAKRLWAELVAECSRIGNRSRSRA